MPIGLSTQTFPTRYNFDNPIINFSGCSGYMDEGNTNSFSFVNPHKSCFYFTVSIEGTNGTNTITYETATPSTLNETFSGSPYAHALSTNYENADKNITFSITKNLATGGGDWTYNSCKQLFGNTKRLTNSDGLTVSIKEGEGSYKNFADVNPVNDWASLTDVANPGYIFDATTNFTGTDYLITTSAAVGYHDEYMVVKLVFTHYEWDTIMLFLNAYITGTSNAQVYGLWNFETSSWTTVALSDWSANQVYPIYFTPNALGGNYNTGTYLSSNTMYVAVKASCFTAKHVVINELVCVSGYYYPQD